MRIGINALFWTANKMGGTQTYVKNLVEQLVSTAPQNRYTLYVNREGPSTWSFRHPSLTLQGCPISGRHPWRRLLWENVVLPTYVRRQEMDILHSLGYLAPLRLDVPSVVTVLDMVHYRWPKEIAAAKRVVWRGLFPASLRVAQRVITVSDAVGEEVSTKFPWARHKIRTVHLGVDGRLFRPSGLAERLVDAPYLLAVASVSPHKNMEVLIRAFAEVHQKIGRLRLVLAGMPTSTCATVFQQIQALSLQSCVEHVGRVSDEDLVKLYGHAEALVFPSRYEGFGLPIIEAMACGCPVIAADRAPMPEVAGGASVLFDPDEPSDLAAAILRLLASPELRKTLVRLGRERAKSMNWEATARKTLDVYAEAQSQSSCSADRRAGGTCAR